MKSLVVATLALWCTTLCQGADKPPYWIDPDTHLMWTAADNGSGVSWIQAQRYCRDLTLAGFHDWTLALDFGDGGRASVAAGDSGLNRALCVRRAQLH